MQGRGLYNRVARLRQFRHTFRYERDLQLGMANRVHYAEAATTGAFPALLLDVQWILLGDPLGHTWLFVKHRLSKAAG